MSATKRKQPLVQIEQCDRCGDYHVSFSTTHGIEVSLDDYSILSAANDMRETEQDIARRLYHEARNKSFLAVSARERATRSMNERETVDES